MRSVTLTCFIAALAVSACGSGENIFVDSMNRQAGSEIDAGNFGQATMDNHLAMTGQQRISMNNRFAADVPATITFPFNSARLTADAQAALRAQARWINQFPEVRFRVYGHTDLVGGNAYNQRLGLRRARAAVAYLASQGVDRRRVEAVVSKGETQPIVATQGREQRNRRTVTQVIGFVGSHPTIMNGKYAEVVFREYVESASTGSRLGGGQSAVAQVGG